MKIIRYQDTAGSVHHAAQQTDGEWEGFWCLSVEKAPKGGFDDVFVTLDPALPQWFIINPAEPLAISVLKNLK